MIFYAIVWAYKLRIIIIFINLKSNIRVGTCLCTHAAALEFLVGVVWFKFKRGFKIIWKCFEIFEKEKEKEFHFPPQLLAQLSWQPTLARGLFASRARPVSRSPVSPPWAKPCWWPSSRACCRLSSLRVADAAGPPVRAAFFATPRPISSPHFTDRIRLQISFFP
jgi:hypothetical protein